MADDRGQGSRRPRQNGNRDRHGFSPRRFSDSGRGRSYGDGERRPYGDREGGQRRSYGDGERRPYGDREGGQRRPYGDREGGQRRSYGDGERRPYGDREGGQRRSYGDGERYSYGRRDNRKAGPRADRFSRDDRRDSRPPQRHRVPEPRVPDDVVPQDLDSSARRELRALGRANAENVARHLVMVQRLLDTDPELAYQHARYAASHAGRIAVVRESAGIAAYLSGHYVEALRDIRAARRLSGLDLHRAIEADCERALGHLGRALKAAAEADPRQLDDTEEAEIAMVVSGVRHEMGQTELGLVVIEEAIMMFRGDRETLRRLHSVRADRLEELGRIEEAQAVRERIGEGPEAEPEDVAVYDIEDELEDETPDSHDFEQDSDDEFCDEEDESWSGSFAERVEAEMAELLDEDDPAVGTPADNPDDED